VTIATIPLSLAYLILATDSLPRKLLIVLLEFLVLGLILKGIQEYSLRRKFTRDYQGRDKIVGIVFSLLGLVSPSWHFAHNAVRPVTKIGKYLTVLAFPLISGLALAIAMHTWGEEEFMARADQLIAIATLGLILNATIEILEHMFRSHRWHLTSLLRIVLGVVIIFLLIS
jgi:hypothetical protein